jgi:hypothetical protein
MTPYSVSNDWFINYKGSVKNNAVTSSIGVRPVINVQAKSTITKGDGTATNYYVLEEDKNGNKTGTIGTIATSGEYVKLENKIYRVVSKESDGVKLILDGYYEETPGTVYLTQYGNDNKFSKTTGIGQKLNGDVLTWLGLSNSDKIKETMYYQGDGLDYGFKYTDVLNSTSNGVSVKVGLIRLGEMLSGQSSTILTKKYTVSSDLSNAVVFWTMNKNNDTSNGWYINNDSYSNNLTIAYTYAIRPVIKVKTDLTISKGNGTWDNPYEI